MSYSASRRSGSSSSAHTRVMIRPTVSQSIRSRRQIAVLSVRAASHATRHSKSRVKPARWRANGTPSASTPWRGQRRRRRPQWISSRQTPRSRCRQTGSTGRVSLRAGVENSHRGHRSRRCRSATSSTTRSASKRTSRTHTPGRHTSRENALLTRTSSSLLAVDFDNQQPVGEGDGASLPSAQPARTSSQRESPAQDQRSALSEAHPCPEPLISLSALVVSQSVRGSCLGFSIPCRAVRRPESSGSLPRQDRVAVGRRA
jgi:hypothetical protein